MNPHFSKLGVAVVAPDGYAPDPDAVARGIARLEQRGILVHNYADHAARHQRFGGTDDARLAQLEAAAADPDVQVVMLTRGGYGLTRLLPRIDFDRLAASGKIFVGYSDFTAFQMAMYTRNRTLTYAGPMFASDFSQPELDEFTFGDFLACLAGPTHTVTGAGTGNPAVDVSGTVWGGNLAMTASLLGTPYFRRIDDGIMYLEDIGEHPYRVERMLLQLLQAGVFERQRALVLGDVSGYRLSPYDNGYDFDSMLAYIRAQLPMPVLTGLEFGHIARHVTIPFGAQGRLTSDETGWRLAMRDYPTLPLR